MDLKLRPVKKEDFKKILEWRNDPEVRKNMFNSNIITWREHTMLRTQFSHKMAKRK